MLYESHKDITRSSQQCGVRIQMLQSDYSDCSSDCSSYPTFLRQDRALHLQGQRSASESTYKIGKVSKALRSIIFYKDLTNAITRNCLLFTHMGNEYKHKSEYYASSVKH
ncbi:unnamed protein product [Owenia fusiformis]|uniref:Uncharacterized protein n=1 Tax=Owenia fusiformis TaxID=6347 RepID=A0A8S4N7F8_OWEFU|nr:unnamed protein product [Owenia fusiformis]